MAREREEGRRAFVKAALRKAKTIGGKMAAGRSENH